ncbi:MAG: hypothetical protein ACRC5D_14990, partial [Aeromonas allosaccharophila]
PAKTGSLVACFLLLDEKWSDSGKMGCLTPQVGKNDPNSPGSGGGAVCYTARLTPLVLALRHLLDLEGLIVEARF